MTVKKSESRHSFAGPSNFKLKPLKMPRPDLSGTGSLREALENRKTTRQVSNRQLPVQILSNLLWSACGINRETGPFGIPGRTSASASNSQEIDIYVALQEGIFVYDPLKHILTPVLAGDYRTYAIGKGQAGFGNNAPVRLIFIADLDRFIHTKGYIEPGLLDPEVQKSYYFTDTGIIAGNVYLFAAASGLGAWFHNCNKTELEALLKLRPDQKVLFGQTIGYQEG